MSKVPIHRENRGNYTNERVRKGQEKEGNFEKCTDQKEKLSAESSGITYRLYPHS